MSKLQHLYTRGKNCIYWMNFKYKGLRIHQSTRTSNVVEALAILAAKKNQLAEQLKTCELNAAKNQASEGEGLCTQESVIDDISRVMTCKRDTLILNGLYLRGKKYWMNFRYKGQRIHQSAETSNKEKAMALLLNKKYEILFSNKWTKHDSTGKLNDIIFDDASILAFHHHFSQQRSVYVKAYKLGVLCNLIGDRYVSQINQSTFTAIEASLSSRGCTPCTINKYFSTVNTVLEVVRKKFNAPCYPIPKVKLATKRKIIRCISYKEEDFILDYFGDKKRIARSRVGWTSLDLVEIYKVGVGTGMRRGELFSFRVEQINGQKIILSPEQHKTGDLSGEKAIVIPKSVLSLLEFRIERIKLRPCERVFGYEKTLFTSLWERMKKAMGLSRDRLFTPHCMRHTFASRMAQRGLPIYFLSKMLGHTSVKTTEMYAHLYIEDLVAAMNHYS